MATVDVTAEEIEDAPLLINPQVKEIKPETRSRLNLILCIVLVVNTIFQLIAIVTPGWIVMRDDISSTYESVYYTIGCVDMTPLENVSTTACTTVTFLNDFSERYNAAKDTIKPSLVYLYNLRVRYQINIQCSWLTVVGTAIFQIIRFIKTNEAYPKLTAINAMILLCACSAMYQALYEAIVKIHFTLRKSEHSAVDVGIPYSVVMYLIAFMQTCACAVIVLKQVYDYTHHIELALIETKVQVDTLQKQFDLEVEEFKHYRQLHSDNNRFGGRSRKSHVDRHSRKGDNRVTSQRHSVKPRGYNDRSPNHSENRNNRQRDFQERTNARSFRKRDKKDRQIRHPDHFAYSGTSRDSSPSSKTHSHRLTRQSQESIELSSQQNMPSCSEGHLPGLHNNMPGLSDASQLIQDSGQTSTQNLDGISQNEQGDPKTINKTERYSHIGRVTDIVSAEVHIPSIDGVEIKS